MSSKSYHKLHHRLHHLTNTVILTCMLMIYIFFLQQSYASSQTVTTIGVTIVATGDVVTPPPPPPPASGLQTNSVRHVFAGGGMGWVTEVIISPPLTVPVIKKDSEMELAFAWAQKYGITHAPTQIQARLYAPISRAELAKMMVQYNTYVKNKSLPQITAACRISNYKDAAIMDAEQKHFISSACSLGIMGRQNNKKDILIYFRPNDPVTRAEFSAVLSRYLYGDKYNGDMKSATWYVKHLRALNDAHYITKIDTPFMKELRGFVMLILYRIQ